LKIVSLSRIQMPIHEQSICAAISDLHRVASCLPTTEIDLMVFCEAYISVASLYVCLLLNSCCVMLTMFYFVKF